MADCWEGPEALKEVVAATLARVLLAERRIEAFIYATRNLTSDERHPNIKGDWDAIYRALFEEQTQAYRDLFMWGCVIGDDVVKLAKQVALEKFLAEGTIIMHQLRHDFLTLASTSYFSITEAELRKEIEKLKEKDA